MRPFHAEIVYEAPIEEVATMLADPQFVEQKVQASKPVTATTDVSPNSRGGFTVTTKRAMSTDHLPTAAQRMVGRTLEIWLIEDWDQAGEDGTRSGTVRLDVTGVPAHATGTMALGRRDGSTVLSYEGTVEAKVPLLGARLEEQAVKQVQSVLNAERRVGTAWLAAD